jgi:hypothetical protein
LHALFKSRASKWNRWRDERFVNARKVNPTNFLTELKRRNVYRAAVAYGVVAWFLTQLTTQVFPYAQLSAPALHLPTPKATS